MPIHTNGTQRRLENTLRCLATAAATLDVLAGGSDLPFLRPISITVQTLLTLLLTAKNNKHECTQLTEQIHKVLYQIIELHVKSDTGQLPPNLLNELGKFTETLHKIHAFVEAQQGTSKFKQLLRHAEISSLFNDCVTSLQQSLAIFKIHGANVILETRKMQDYAHRTHEEVLTLIEFMSDCKSDKSSIQSFPFRDSGSRGSLALLPSEPKIFYGRDVEVSAILDVFAQEAPRIAILGTGGMGKTTLAKVILHSSEITARFGQHRFFVACDTASAGIDLATIIQTHLCLNSGRDSTGMVLKFFRDGPPCLLVIDNLESVWEPAMGRNKTENLLCLLADVEHLTLMVTMRGAERPGKVRWTRPFLKPLSPLPQDAARHTFLAITDEDFDFSDIDKVLNVTGNIPLVIELISHVVEVEGLHNTLSRWKMETTSLVSEGHDHTSNLDLSISLSLSSPRIERHPQARELLGLLAVLPDGLSEADLQHSKLPLVEVLGCKSALLQTSLAYSDEQGRLRVLAPIGEHMRKYHPSAPKLIHSLLVHFEELLQTWRIYSGTASNAGLVARITANVANIDNILRGGLHPHAPNLIHTIECAIFFSSFCRLNSRGTIDLMDRLPGLLAATDNHKVKLQLITEILQLGGEWRPITHPQVLIDQGLECCRQLDNPSLACRFYIAANIFYLHVGHDSQLAFKFLQSADSISMHEDTGRRPTVLCQLAWVDCNVGDYSSARVHALESQRLARLAGNVYLEARALEAEIYCCRRAGKYSTAIQLCERARRLLALGGMSCGSLDNVILNEQASTHMDKTEYCEARRIHTQSLSRESIDTGSYRYAFTLMNITLLDVATGTEADLVRKQNESIRSIIQSTGVTWRLIHWSDLVQVELKLKEGALGEARKSFIKMVAFSWSEDAELLRHCLERLGDGCRWGSPDQMSSWTVVFLVYALKTGQKRETYKGFQFLGDLYLGSRDHDTATSLFILALEGFSAMDVHCSKAECLLRLGDICKERGNPGQAATLWEAARPLFERSFPGTQVEPVDERMTGIHGTMKTRS